MGRSQESFRKKEVRNRKEQKRKAKEKKKAAKGDGDKKSSLDDMIAYVDSNGVITDTPPDPDDKEEINAEDIETSVPKKEDLGEEDLIRKGTITYFNDQKGFGFIKDSKTQEDIFVHINDAQEDLKEGNLVSFEVVAGNRGPAAANVKVER